MENEPFDGFAIDLFTAGVILFIMLVGIPPFEWANMGDSRFSLISQGGLESLLAQWGKSVSPEAANLLQSMLNRNPRERLSLFQVVNHPWVALQSPSENGNESIKFAIELMSPPQVDEVSDDESSDESVRSFS